MSANAMSQSKLKKDALAIFKAGLSAVDPAQAVAKAVSRSGETLKILNGKKTIRTINLKKIDQIFLVGAGKATAPMAKAMEKILGKRVTAGVISVNEGNSLKLKKTKVIEAGHPIPNDAGVKAAKEMVALLEQAGPDDLVVSLISGGGSALMPLPAKGLRLKEKQSITKSMLACGASIHEMNAVRKHLSQIKGGQMAQTASPAAVINLMLSDVVGDDMDTIASGPFVPDQSTFEDVAVILAKYKLMKKIPAAIRNLLIKKGLTGELPETPKEGDEIFKNVSNVIIGSNYHCLKAVEVAAKENGYKPLLLSSTIQGETREIARMHGAIAREIISTGNPVKAPACVISGGETTVTLRGKGKGGRNQEFALAAALEIDGLDNLLIFSGGTDGVDGATDAAGAVADGTTCARAAEKNLSPYKHLEENDAYPFFEKLGDLIKTKPTRTNVMDVRLILVDK